MGVFSGAPRSVPGAPHAVPGGPFRSGQVRGSRIQSGYSSFSTTVPDRPSSGQWRDEHTKQIRDFQGRYSGPQGIAWQGLDVLSEAIYKRGKAIKKGADEAADQLKDEMVSWMQTNHPWENDTGDAEKGLKGAVVKDDTRTVIWIGHGVPYGIWLELMQNGRFAVLQPTILRFGVQFGARIAAHV